MGTEEKAKKGLSWVVKDRVGNLAKVHYQQGHKRACLGNEGGSVAGDRLPLGAASSSEALRIHVREPDWLTEEPGGGHEEVWINPFEGQKSFPSNNMEWGWS